MEFNINPETAKQATKCLYNHACMQPGTPLRCTISEVVNNTVFFTKEKKPSACPYQSTFGNSFMCTCPLRQEFYLKHKV